MSRSLDFGEKNVRILLNPDVKFLIVHLPSEFPVTMAVLSPSFSLIRSARFSYKYSAVSAKAVNIRIL